MRLCQGCLLASKVNWALLDPGEDGGSSALNVVFHRVQSCPLQSLSFGWPEPLALPAKRMHSSDAAGRFHYETSQNVDSQWFHSPGLAAEEDSLTCDAIEEVAFGFGRDTSAREHARQVSPNHLALVEVVPRGKEVIVGVRENSPKVQLGVDSFEGDAVDGDHSILGFALASSSFRRRLVS